MTPKEAEHRQQEAESLVKAARERRCETCRGSGRVIVETGPCPDCGWKQQPCPDCEEKP